MESVSVAILIFMFCVSLILGSSNSYVTQGLDYVATVSESSKTYEYERIDEVKKHCAFVLSSATELKPDSNWVHRIKEELKFGNGDWKQDVGNAPIMPFHDRDMPKNLPSYLNVVSFWVTDVDIAHQSKKSVSVSGVLVIGRTRDISDAERLFEESPQFQMWPGHSLLTILFEGIYAETKKKGGERVMCMLGSAMLPSRESDSSEPWGWMKASGSNYSQPPLSQDDQILLVLHYPMNFRLTSRTIQGEMTSLNSKSNLKHFDSIHILSQLGDSAKYEFLSEAIVSKACHPYPCQDNLMTDVIEIYKGHRFCEILQQVTRGGAFTVVPNWRCNVTDEFCSKLGPFGSDKEIRATDGSFKDVPLFMQNLKCEEALGQGNVSSARVAAVFRASPPSGNEYSARWRSDPSNMTVAAEGLWKSSSGQLCMIGCPGLVDSEGSNCNSRILLYVPLSFSIKQRSIILGSFSSTNDSDASYFPLSFEKLVQPLELWNYFKSSRPYYRYSKLEKAGVLLEKKEPFSVGTVIKKSLLHYPKLEDTESFMNSLSLLSEDLTLQISAVPDPLTNSQTKRVYVQVEILSLGPLFGRYWSLNNTTLTIEEDTPYHTDVQYTEKQLLMNVSAQLSLIGEGYQNLSVVFLEGLYDPHFGKMYLVGCRDVRASWNILFESMDLEGGLDCLINVVVTYPSTTTRWFVNPKAKISISSQRTEDDPLYFKTISLQTLPIMYRKQREDILSHMGVEGILRMVTLSFAIACISSQLFYIKHDLDSVPFISLVMLVVQALGYCLPLITDAEALFKRMTTESYESSTYDLEKNQWIHIIDYAVKILVMVSFLLTLRLCQKVWKSRIRLLTRTPLEPHRIPSEKWVLLGTLTIHVVGYVFVLIINAGKTSQRSLRRVYSEPAGYSHKWKELEIELEEYMGLVQDFFLLPQVIGNLLWQINCKPLRKLYFIGITVVRLLPHVYDYIRTPPNPYFDEDYEFANPNLDFFSKFGDVAIPATAIFLAAVVYIQQRWSYDKLSQTLTFGHCRLLPMGSRVYERLPSKSFEAELVSGVDGNAAHETERDDED